MPFQSSPSPRFLNRLQLASILLIVVYMLVIGGSYSATVEFRIQAFNAVTAGIIAVLWLAMRLRSRARLTGTGLEWALVFFVATQWITALASPQPRLSLEQALAATGWALVFVAAADLLNAGWPKEYFINALVVCAVLVTGQAVWEVVNWFVAWAQIGVLPPLAFRAYGFLGHPNLTAGVLNLLLPLVIVKAWRSPSRFGRLTLALLAVLMLTAEFFTSSRAGWIAAALSLATLIGLGTLAGATSRWMTAAAYWRSLGVWVQGAIVLSAACVLAGGSWVAWQQTRHATHSNIFISRQEFWGPAVTLWGERPLTGGGPGLYAWSFTRWMSVPPGYVSPHAHSLVFQLIGDNGLLGLLSAGVVLVAVVVRLRQRWLAAGDKLWSAAFISGLTGFLAHHLFDYLFGTPAFTFLFVLFGVLALTDEPPASPQAGYHPAWLIAPLLAISGLTAFSLRAAFFNSQGVELAARNQWVEAESAFSQAAQFDPGLTLYWQNAAYAATRADRIEDAIRLWERAARDDPYWAVLPATVAVLRNDPEAMEPALALAPRSDLFYLNAGVLSEARGDSSGAALAYRQALTLNPKRAAALFWQQSDLRKNVLADWQAAHPLPESSLANGWEALKANQVGRAVELFHQAQSEEPLSSQPYVGLAAAYWAAGDETKAVYYLRAAKLFPILNPSDIINTLALEGDWAIAHGDRTRAVQAYLSLFSAYNDYTTAGPASYGYPERSWHVYHRPAVSSDMVPQWVRADITAELDGQFAQLAQWFLEDGAPDKACFVLYRVYREAPASKSGTLWAETCR